jgi:tetratricopeptide (TPR) repeat protein
MAREIFISLTVHDTPIARALEAAFQALFGDVYVPQFSSSKSIGTGISAGENWFKWIVERVRACDFALILITPSSVNKPWILWEAAAVAGAAISGSEGSLRKVRPLLFQVTADFLPSPLTATQVQLTTGDDEEGFGYLLDQMLNDALTVLPPKLIAEFGHKKAKVVAEYLSQVRQSLLEAPAVAAPSVIEEWLQRLDELKRDRRASEAEHLHGWMNIAFGRVPKKAGEQQPPLDLRIHSRLADLYLKAKKPKQAIAELQLAMQIAPRDIFTLRLLGKAYLDDGDRDQARAILERIKKLDPRATIHNAECAALDARWHLQGGDNAGAAAVLDAALKENPDSYYLADRLAQAHVEGKRKDAAAQAYEQALAIIQRLGEDNAWVLSTAANAAFFLGKDTEAAQTLRSIWNKGVDKGTWATIERGLHTLSGQVDNGIARLSHILAQAKG